MKNDIAYRIGLLNTILHELNDIIEKLADIDIKFIDVEVLADYDLNKDNILSFSEYMALTTFDLTINEFMKRLEYYKIKLKEIMLKLEKHYLGEEKDGERD